MASSKWRYLWSWLFYVNFLFFQWFFVRLCEVLEDDGKTHIRWEFLRWVVPATGWWTNYVYWPHKRNENIKHEAA